MPAVDPLAVKVTLAMRLREVGLRAHLDQARGRALELLLLEALGAEIERIRLRCGGSHELDCVVVERVDQQ